MVDYDVSKRQSTFKMKGEDSSREAMVRSGSDGIHDIRAQCGERGREREGREVGRARWDVYVRDWEWEWECGSVGVWECGSVASEWEWECGSVGGRVCELVGLKVLWNFFTLDF